MGQTVMKTSAPLVGRRSRRLDSGDNSNKNSNIEQSNASRPNKRQKPITAHQSTDPAPRTPAKKSSSKAAKIKGGPDRLLEQQFWAQGYDVVLGVDEAGRGPLAGPVVAAACAIPNHINLSKIKLDGINDSKQVPHEEREKIYSILTSHPEIVWGVSIVDVNTIDEINILQATMKAMSEAVENSKASKTAAVLVDGNRLPVELDPNKSKAITKGDTKSVAIAAASIIAKVTRDRIMLQLHEKFPQYGFANHKGYGVAAHVAAIKQHGPCEAHRRTFAPVKDWFPSQKKP